MLEFVFLGLGTGAITALAAQGLVLVYRGSGVVNLALGAFAMIGAFAYDEAHRGGLPPAVSIVVALALAGLIGAGFHLLVLRNTSGSSLVRVVATLGLLTAIQAACLLRYGGNVKFVEQLLPHDGVQLAGTIISADRFWLIGISAVLGAVLWAVYRFTTFGLTTSAVAENERAAASLGRSPELVATVNWALGAMLAGAAGVLVAPIVGLSATQLGLLLMPALAAALVGGFRSFGITWAAALAIGVAQAELTRYVSVPGLAASLPFLVVIAVLALRGQAIPVRGFTADRLPLVGDGRVRVVPLAVVAVAGLVVIALLPADWAQAAMTTSIIAVICLSVVVVTGYAGQLSLAQYALAGVGAYIAARASAAAGFPFWLAALAGVAGTIPVGLLVGLPSLRTRGVSLGIATLGLALAVQNMVFNNNDLTGGALGTVVAPPSLAGVSLDPVAHPQRYAAFAFACLVVVGLVVANLRRGAIGRRMVAVRSNERAAASLGVSVAATKLYAFAVGSGIAAVAGVILAFQAQHVVFNGFDVMQSIQMVVLSVLGGVGFVAGGAMGGVAAEGGVVSFGMQHVSSSDQWLALITGVGLLFGVVMAPDGAANHMATNAKRLARVVRRRLARPAGTSVAAAAAPARAGSGDPAPAPAAAVTRRAGAALRVEELGVRFGEVVALDGVTLDVAPGQVTGLIGANGAGKTTFIDLVTGLTRPTAGRVLLGGDDVSRLAAHGRARRGIVRSFQSLELFEDLTVRDNLGVGCEPRRRAAYVADLVRPRSTDLPPGALEAVREFALEAELDKKPGELSYGHRRLVGIARALAADPAVLLLDEPAAGLDRPERGELVRVLRWVAEQLGIAVLLVEHDVGLVVEACDQVAVLDHGRLIALCTPQEVRSHPAVVAAYLGAEEGVEPVTAGEAKGVPA